MLYSNDHYPHHGVQRDPIKPTRSQHHRQPTEGRKAAWWCRVSSYGKRTYTHHSTWMDGRERQTLSITKTTHRHRVYQHSTDTGSSKRQQNYKTTRHHRDTEAKKSLRLRLHVKTTRRTYHQRSSMARRHPSIRILLLLNVSLQERPTLTSCIE